MKQDAARKHGLTYVFPFRLPDNRASEEGQMPAHVGHPRRAEKTGAWSRAQAQYPGKERIVLEVMGYGHEK